MNLRQQFFWKLLIGLSAFIILVSLYNSYSKYSELAEYKKEGDEWQMFVDSLNFPFISI